MPFIFKKLSKNIEIDNLILLKTDVFKYLTHTASRFDLIFPITLYAG
jgi:hypothetical protein